MNLINHLTRIFITNNIFIGICAVAISLSTYLINKASISGEAVLLMLFIFLSSIVVYNINKVRLWFDADGDMKKSGLFSLMICSLIALAVLSVYLPIELLAFSVHLGVLSLLYVLPVRYRQKEYSLRNIPLLKIFVLSYVWAGVTAGLPAMQIGLGCDKQFFYLMLERFLFIFALAIPFDIRDYKLDKRNGLITLPGLIGISNSIRVNQLVLFLFVMFSFWVYGVDFVSFSRLISGVVALFLVRVFLRRCDSSSYFMFDGIMIVHFVIIAVFKVLN